MGIRLLILSAFICLPALADYHRGLWFWGNTTLPDDTLSPYGSAIIVGDGAAEDESINFFAIHHVKRLYGSYQNRPVSEPSVIRAWNAKLDAAGVQSQLLIDGNAVNDPDEVTNILSKITNRFITFNAGASPAQKFDALHLDLEPQGLPEWDSGTAADKRELLDDLLQAYIDIRNLLDAAGLSMVPIYADIPFSWDKLPADGGSIAWADATDRDNWFAAIDTPLAGVSIMTFSKDTYAELAEATEYERTGPLSEARVAIQPKCGPDELWPTSLHFNSVMHQLEINLGPSEAVDIENYAFWRYAITHCGIEVGPPIVVILPSTGTGALPWPPTVINTGGVAEKDPALLFPALSGHTHTVRTSTDLSGNWTNLIELRTTHPAEPEMFLIPVPTQAPRRFWRIESVPDSNP